MNKNMRNGMWDKELIFVIIGLFIGASVVPSIYGKDIKNCNEISIDKTIISLKSDSLSTAMIPPVDYPYPSKYIRSLEDILLGNNLPSLTGTRPLLVILADFSDKTHNVSHDINYFENIMWGIKPSLSTYYSEVSYGKFTFIPGVVIGWYQIDVTQSWAENHSQEFVVKAVNSADDDFNFSPYDTDNDGMVTHEELTLVIVHPSDFIIDVLVHQWNTQNEIVTDDHVTVEGSYSIMTEWSSMGVFAHEIAHDIGLPDLYDLGKDSFGIGAYGLMGYGIYRGPTHMTAWSKIQLGWLTPTIINTNSTYTLNDVETHAEAFIFCDLHHSVFEYFLIENRWKGNSYDGLLLGEWWSPKQIMFLEDLPDEGIVIYHIDDKKASSWWDNGWNTVNSKEEHKGVDVECSDKPSSHLIDADDLDSIKNKGDDTDLWDITAYDFDDASSPCNATWYDGTPSGCAIRNFSAKGSTITMNISIPFERGNYPPNIPTITGPNTGETKTSYTYEFTTLDPEGGLVFYYIDWGDGSSTGWISPEKSGSTNKINYSWVEKGTYLIRIKAKDIFGAESDWGTLSVTMPYSHNKPVMQFWMKLLERLPNAFLLLRHL